MRRLLLIGLVALLAVPQALAEDEDDFRTPSPDGAQVYFISPGDRATITGPVTIRFGLTGMGVAPAGIEAPDTGHHHLLINAELPALDEPMPTEDHLVHFGRGQTETTLDLPPGQHTLQLVLGDLNHIAHWPPVISEPITITVK